MHVNNYTELTQFLKHLDFLNISTAMVTTPDPFYFQHFQELKTWQRKQIFFQTSLD